MHISLSISHKSIPLTSYSFTTGELSKESIGYLQWQLQ